MNCSFYGKFIVIGLGLGILFSVSEGAVFANGQKTASECERYLVDRNAFESDTQFNDYLLSLRKGRLTAKHTYIGQEGAKAEAVFMQSKDYGLNDTETNLLQSNISSVVAQFNGNQPLHIVDVGPGAGAKALLVIGATTKSKNKVEYTGVDYSQSILKLTEQTIKSRFPSLKTQSVQNDVEVTPLGERLTLNSSEQGLFLLLGQTLGNPVQRADFLNNIQSAMRPEDKLLIGVELYEPQKVPEILSHYRNKDLYDAVFVPLRYAGLRQADGNFEVIFNQQTKDVEVSFVLGKKVTIMADGVEPVYFQKGQSIQIFKSHKFTKDELQSLLEETRFSSLQFRVDTTSNYALILAKPLPKVADNTINEVLSHNLYVTDDAVHLKTHVSSRLEKYGEKGDLRPEWGQAPARLESRDGEQLLIIKGLEVMSDFEKPYMAELAKTVTSHGGKVLNVGFGLGLIDSFIEAQRRSRNDLTEHHIIEMNEDVYKTALKWRAKQTDKEKIFIHHGDWKVVAPKLAKQGIQFDGIVYDAYPLNINEISRDSVDFLESTIKLRLVKEKTGIVTFYADSTDGFGKGFKKFLRDLGVEEISLSRVEVTLPNRKSEYWSKPFFLVPLLGNIRYR